MPKDNIRLYELIWKKISSQMSSAINIMNIDIDFMK